jgi:hypothetical protein
VDPETPLSSSHFVLPFAGFLEDLMRFDLGISLSRYGKLTARAG